MILGIDVSTYLEELAHGARFFDGEREIPVTGISISGKLSEALANMRLCDTPPRRVSAQRTGAPLRKKPPAECGTKLVFVA